MTWSHLVTPQSGSNVESWIYSLLKYIWKSEQICLKNKIIIEMIKISHIYKKRPTVLCNIKVNLKQKISLGDCETELQPTPNYYMDLPAFR